MKLNDTNLQLILSILISLTIACFVEQQVFFDRSAINDDVRNQIYWMAQQNDPQLFHNDLIASYFTQASTISPPLKFFYGLFPDSLDPKIISQFLPFVLVILATIFLFKFAASIAGPRYAFWLSFVFSILIWMLSNMPGGLPRAFFYPLLFLFFYLYAKKWWLGLITLLIAQTQIYPVVFFISITILSIELIFDRVQKKITPQSQIYSTIAGVIAGLAALYFRFIYKHTEAFGPMTSLAEALSMPEFFIKGRIKAFLIPYELFHQGFSLNLISINKDFFSCVTIKLAVILPLLVICFYLYKNLIQKKIGQLIIPRILYSAIVSAILLYILASLTLFYLYLPQRYIEYSMPLISIFVIGSFMYHLELALPKYKTLAASTMIVISILVIFSSWHNGLKAISQSEQDLYSYLRTLPKDIMIATPYNISSDIPAYAYRSVIVSHEGYIPFHKDYYKEMQSRLIDLQEVYRTDDIRIVKNFIKKYNIDYLIVKTKGEDSSKRMRVFNSTPKDCLDFSNKDYILISSQKILAACYN